MKRKAYPDDDDRTIVDMNVEGMPWYRDGEKGDIFGRPGKKKRPETAQDLSREEERAIFWGSMKAALLIGGIFTVCAVLFTLFCVFVWLR